MAVSLAGMTLHTNNDNEGGWGGTDGPDDYNNSVQGTNSEAWQVSKNSTETGTLTKSSSLNTSRGLFTFWMSSNLAPYYTDIDLILQSTSGNLKTYTVATAANKAIGGDFVASAIDYVNKGTETGTFAPASFSSLSLVLDNSASGNIRSVINNWMDAMYYGPGHTITGTTTTDKLFNEAAAEDNLVANMYGVIWNYKGGIFCQGDLTLNGTALVSSGETLFFVDTVNGYSTYNLNGTGTVEFTNTSVVAAGTIAVDFNASSLTSFSMVGGALSGLGITTIVSGNTFDGVVLTDRSTSSIGNTSNKCTWNSSGLLTVTGILSSCILNKSIASSAVSAGNLNKTLNCVFTKDTGDSHAVTLTGSAGSYSWSSTGTGYDTGSVGDGVEITGGSITGNEMIHITATTGTFIINVGTGSTTPSVSSAGAVVNVVAGQKTLTFTDLPTDVEVRIRQGSYTIHYTGNITGGTDSYTYTYVAGILVTITVGGSGYIRETIDYTLNDADASLSFPLKPDPSYIP